jgi:predicted kinase
LESRRLLVVMCGLPGSGKSTIARALADRLRAPRWDKDEIRHLLFPPAIAEHDRPLNDACMELLYAALPSAFERFPVVILDGRPFATRAQRLRARRAAADVAADITFIHCMAPIPILKSRLETGGHPAPDRDAALVDRLAREWEPLEADAVVIDTGTGTAADAVEGCLLGLRVPR